MLPVQAVRRAVLLLGAAPAVAALAWWGSGALHVSAGGLAWAGALWLGWAAGVAALLWRHRRAAAPAPVDWLAHAAHALRNRLAALGGATEVLAAPLAEPAVRARAHAIAVQQLRHLADLAGNLAELAQADAPGAGRASHGPQDLAALALAALDAQRPLAAAAGQLLLHATQPAPVLGDAHALEQAVAALLRHALGQLPVGAGLVLEVRAEPPEAVLRLRSDRAAPSAALPSPELPHDDPDLGLALAQCNVARHGGRLSIAGGADPAIELRLPLQPGAAPQRSNKRPAHGTTGLRLLLVEDVAGVRDSLAAQLRGEGHAVSAQADGEAGLRSLLTEWPDAAVVDLSLPGMSACALARSARRAGYAGRMVAVAGYEPSPERAEALRAGFDACLNKPVRAGQLRQALVGRG
nr:response regulator [Variovorax boronicumulans]